MRARRFHSPQRQVLCPQTAHREKQAEPDSLPGLRRTGRGQGRIWLLSVLFFVAATGCMKGSFYTPQQIEAQLTARYGLHFTISLPISEGARQNERHYSASCAEVPQLKFEVLERWTPPGWSGGSNGVPPLPHGASHILLDSFRAAQWNRDAVPLLAQYGVYGLEVSHEQRFYGVDYFGEAVQAYSIYLAEDLDSHTEQLYNLLSTLSTLPAFQSCAMQEQFPDYGIPIVMTAADGIGNTTERLRLAAGSGWTRDSLRERLDSLRRTVRNNLKREMERAGIAAPVLAQTDFPAIGRDFFYLSGEQNNIFSGVSIPFQPSEEWDELRSLLQKNKFYAYPPAEILGNRYFCISAGEATQENACMLCIDAETGMIWQYGSRMEHAFLVSTGCILPVDALAGLS